MPSRALKQVIMGLSWVSVAFVWSKGSLIGMRGFSETNNGLTIGALVNRVSRR